MVRALANLLRKGITGSPAGCSNRRVPSLSIISRPLLVPLATAEILPVGAVRSQVGMPLAPTFWPYFYSRSNRHSPLLASRRSRPLELRSLILEVNFLRHLLKFLGITIPGHEVFLSFRGPDIGSRFASHLRKSLEAAGVSVYWDRRDIPMGEQIGKELLQAVRTCLLALPIISPHFVGSRWCNRELVEMIKCRQEHGLLVIPINYNVDPVDVGSQNGKFIKDLRILEKWLGKEEVLKFVEALTSVASIRGWSWQTNADELEAELVERVTIKALSELKMMFIKQLPGFIRLVCLNILEKKRIDSECQVLLVCDDQEIQFDFVDHLKVGLEYRKIRVFGIDDPSLLGKDIAHEIRNAIDKCIICILIITKENCDSSFVETIVQILESKETNGLKVGAIFLNVTPSQLKHVSVHPQHKDKREGTYKQALEDLASLRGWVSNNNVNRKRGELVMEVAEYVSSWLNNP